MQYEIHFHRYGDEPRVRRGPEGSTRRFTKAEARRFLARNRHRYPRARIVPIGSSSKTPTVDKRRGRIKHT